MDVWRDLVPFAMKQALLLVVVASCVPISCGTDGGVPMAGGGTASEIKLPTVPVPANTQELSLPKPKNENPFACANDDDCWTSCKYGAVNKNWYQDNVDPKSECKDGCASKGSAAKCEDGECVTYLMGKRAEHCTKRKVE
jgi:hypothetical protein